MTQKPSVLFLTYRIAQGYGVDEVILQYCKFLNSRGVPNEVVCVEKLATVGGVRISEMLPSSAGLSEKLRTGEYTHAIAHTEPWISLLAEAELTSQVKKIAWEHGDPTPELFHDEQEKAKRREEKDNKLSKAYPKMSSVVAISEFVREDINWPSALVIPNPMPSFPPAPSFSPTGKPSPLKLGCLMRLGPGEAQYKGSDLFLKLASEIKKHGFNVEVCLAGRGTAKDAEAYTQEGIKVSRNISLEGKQKFLASLDLFISPSLWEGFNLPVVEAQALGTPSMLFDAGAHPEVCPHVMPSIEQALLTVKTLESNREQLHLWSKRGLNCVQRLRERAPEELFLNLLKSTTDLATPEQYLHKKPSYIRFQLLGLQHGWKSLGAIGFLMWLLKKTARKIVRR